MKTIVRCSAVLLATSLLACSRPAVQPATAPRLSNNLQTDEVDSGPVDAGRPEAIAAPLAATSPTAANEASPVETGNGSGAAAAPPASTGGTAAVTSAEQRLCDSLRRAASPLVEDTPNGARLWLKPRGTTDRVTVKRLAGDLERALAEGGASTNSPCIFFQLAAEGADVRMREENGDTRLDVTDDPAARPTVRAALRRFAENAPQK
jgi:hypothetical protein